MLGEYTVNILKFSAEEEKILSSLENKFLMNYSARLFSLNRKERDAKARELIQEETGHMSGRLSEMNIEDMINYISGYGIIDPLIKEDDVEEILASVKTKVKLPVSICIHPVNLEEMKRLQKAGAQKIGIAVDACTPELFEKIKGAGRRGPYRWDHHLEAMQQALEVFGPGNVTTHLIVGLGETEVEASDFIIKMYEMGITVGLFAFTAIRGTALEEMSQPALESYRRLQVLRYLVANKLVDREVVSADEKGKLELKTDVAWLRETLSSGEAFRVTGCSGCNRPYYNERPRGPMYNYPRPLSEDEVHKALAEAGFVSRDGRV